MCLPQRKNRDIVKNLKGEQPVGLRGILSTQNGMGRLNNTTGVSGKRGGEKRWGEKGGGIVYLDMQRGY